MRLRFQDYAFDQDCGGLSDKKAVREFRVWLIVL
jgi:hypothetical protein